MFDLSFQCYDEVNIFLQQQMQKITKPSCVIQLPKQYSNAKLNNKNNLYELFVITMDDEYFDDPTVNYNVLFNKCYYYVLEYNDEAFYNEISVLDCGGYYIAVCVFLNKQNITNEIIYNNCKSNQDDYYSKIYRKR